MIINNLYQTKITCNNYNPSIDSNVTVTVKLEDFNKRAVANKPVTLTCSKGYFTSVTHNGGTTSLNKTKTTNSYNTNSNGEITAIWTASEWGYNTFLADNSNIQVLTTGYKVVQKPKSGVTVYSDGKNGYIELNGNITDINNNTSSANYGLITTISTEYAPLGYVVVGHHHITQRGNGYHIGINSNAQLFVKLNLAPGSSGDAPSSLGCYCGLFYPLKNPKY